MYYNAIFKVGSYFHWMSFEINEAEGDTVCVSVAKKIALNMN